MYVNVGALIVQAKFVLVRPPAMTVCELLILVLFVNEARVTVVEADSR
jgi:hypothetical protein